MANTLGEGTVTLAELRAYFPGLAAAAEASIRNPVDPETAEWLDGPGFVRWLARHGIDEHDLDRLSEQDMRRLKGGGRYDRAVRRWKDGGAVSLATADRILTDRGDHLLDLPDVLWRRRPPHRRLVASDDLRRAVVAAVVGQGRSQNEVAAEHGIERRTIRKWIAEAREGGGE